MQSAQAVTQQTLGLRWQEKLPQMSKEELVQEAEYLWAHFGFPRFLDRAMKKLIAESPHRLADRAELPAGMAGDRMRCGLMQYCPPAALSHQPRTASSSFLISRPVRIFG
jgi:hypothetical protein